MSNTYAKLLHSLRTEHQFSQIFTAKALGISRASYLGLERGARELSLREAIAITQLYGIQIDDLIKNNRPDVGKYKMMILTLLRAAKADGVVLKKTKLSLLLYLADMRSYYEAKESMSGMTYRKGEFGPTTDAYFRLIDELERTGIVTITQVIRDDYHMYEIKESRASARTKISLLSPKEQKSLEEICHAWINTPTTELQQFINTQRPMSETAVGSGIAYKLIIGEAPHRVVTETEHPTPS